MKILAIMGSYRTGKTIDSLVDRAIAGAESSPGVHVDKVVLIDRRIEYCRTACLDDLMTLDTTRVAGLRGHFSYLIAKRSDPVLRHVGGDRLW